MATPTTQSERDYVLGTHDEELERLGLQHRVWRPRALDAWRRAGFTVGQTLLDVGSGPGHATRDLAEVVGPTGKIVAIDRSRRYLDFVQATSKRLGLTQVETVEQDLDEAGFPAIQADGAWTRWVLAFLKRPRDLLARVKDALKPGGIFVAHEYIHYGSWGFAPRSPQMEEFVRAVVEGWRASGGEPDIGLELPRWLEEMGFEIQALNPIVDIVAPSNFVWQWPKAFVKVGLDRLVELKLVTPERAQAMAAECAAMEAAPHTRMITPMVLEIIAVRR